jgi:hypothetical protein
MTLFLKFLTDTFFLRTLKLCHHHKLANAYIHFRTIIFSKTAIFPIFIPINFYVVNYLSSIY